MIDFSLEYDDSISQIIPNTIHKVTTGNLIFLDLFAIVEYNRLFSMFILYKINK
jgi:hypothetical protein